MLGKYAQLTPRGRAFLDSYLDPATTTRLVASVNAGEGLLESETRPRRLAHQGREVLDGLLPPDDAARLARLIDADADRFMKSNHARTVPEMRADAERKSQRAEYMRKYRRGLVGKGGNTDVNQSL